jgi:hypothetical protein
VLEQHSIELKFPRVGIGEKKKRDLIMRKRKDVSMVNSEFRNDWVQLIQTMFLANQKKDRYESIANDE